MMSSYSIIILLFVSLISVSQCSHSFTKIPGRLKQVTASVNYFWGVTSSRRIYICPQQCTTGQWKNIRGSLVQIDAGDHEVWGVNRYYQIFKRPVDGSGSWTTISGRARDVSASGNGYIFVVGKSYYLHYCKKPCSGKWVRDTRISYLRKVDAGYSHVYVLNYRNYVYYRPIDGSSSWRYAGGRFIAISVGAQYLYAISRSYQLYRCRLPCYYRSKSWQKVTYSSCFQNIRLIDIEASVNSLIASSNSYLIYRAPLKINVSLAEEPTLEVELTKELKDVGNENKFDNMGAEDEGKHNGKIIMKDDDAEEIEGAFKEMKYNEDIQNGEKDDNKMEEKSNMNEEPGKSNMNEEPGQSNMNEELGKREVEDDDVFSF